MKFFIKQLVGLMASPIVVAFLLVALAGVLRIAGRRRPALWTVIAALATLYLGTIAPVAFVLLAPLERQYPPFLDEQPVADVAAVVVLGSSYIPRGRIPVTGALDPDGLARIVEGVRLLRRMPEARLIVSGGAGSDSAPTAHGYARLARELGVPETSIQVLDTPRDTRGEAEAVARLLGQRRFILVTSAYHMPRAMRLMQRAGVHPVPAPTAQRLRLEEGMWHSLMPGSNSLQRVERALHEYLGLVAMSTNLD